MSTTSLWNDLRKAVQGDYRFTAVFTYVGANYDNKSGESNKFWAIERTQDGGDLQLRYGPISPNGTTDGGRTLKARHPAGALEAARRKEKKGYTFRRFHTWTPGGLVKPNQSNGFDPSVFHWAQQRRAPFNRIRTLCVDTGEARDATGKLVCRMPVEQVRDILAGL